MVKRAKLMMAGVFAMILALGLVTTTPAPVEAQQFGLVNVSISGPIATNIANNLDVNVSQIPLTVQVPIGVAANVCNTAVNVLAIAAQRGEANCDAETTSVAFNRFVQGQLLSQ